MPITQKIIDKIKTQIKDWKKVEIQAKSDGVITDKEKADIEAAAVKIKKAETRISDYEVILNEIYPPLETYNTKYQEALKLFETICTRGHIEDNADKTTLHSILDEIITLAKEILSVAQKKVKAPDTWDAIRPKLTEVKHLKMEMKQIKKDFSKGELGSMQLTLERDIADLINDLTPLGIKASMERKDGGTIYTINGNTTTSPDSFKQIATNILKEKSRPVESFKAIVEGFGPWVTKNFIIPKNEVILELPSSSFQAYKKGDPSLLYESLVNTNFEGIKQMAWLMSAAILIMFLGQGASIALIGGVDGVAIAINLFNIGTRGPLLIDGAIKLFSTKVEFKTDGPKQKEYMKIVFMNRKMILQYLNEKKDLSPAEKNIIVNGILG